MVVKKPKKSSPPPAPGTPESYNAVLIEEVRSQMQLVIEESQSTKSFLSQRMAEDKKEICDRLEVIENVVRLHSGQLADLGTKMDRVVDKVERHDDDIATLKEASRSP